VPSLAKVYDEPFADSSQLPTVLVSRLARESVTVALSGDGGDELFGGYSRYLWWDSVWTRSQRMPRRARATVGGLIGAVSPARWNSLTKILAPFDRRGRLQSGVVGDRIAKAGAMLSASTPDGAYDRLIQRWHFGNSPVLGAVEPIGDVAATVPRTRSFVEAMMYRDLVGYLPDDILVKVDRASMAVALEVRVPMLDYRVVDRAWAIPLNEKIVGGQGKQMLRRILARDLPGVDFERPKAGFAVPIGDWLRGPLRPWAEDLLQERKLRDQELLDADLVGKLWTAHLKGKARTDDAVWAVLMFQSWLARAR
jgi:asparagine synthase (glutamine-hydrolysing)